MKKIFLTFSLASAFALASAQDMNSKNGFPILPESKDWSIGFDAVPVLNAIGNVFHQNGGNGPFSEMNNTLVGLYMKNEKTAYRAKLRIGFGSSTITNPDSLISADSVNTASEIKTSSTHIAMGFGLQKSRGKGRLHGIYGVELMVGFGNRIAANGTQDADSTYTYTHVIDSTHQTTGRTTEWKSGSNFNIGLNGFIGAEYFFAPKMSVSAEYGWGLLMNSNAESEATGEKWDAANNAVKPTTSKGAKDDSFKIDVMNSASIVLHCYF